MAETALANDDITVVIEDDRDNSDLRWTVDTAEDLQVVRKIYEGMGLGESVAPYREVLAFVRARPDIGSGNAHVIQKDA